MITNKRDDEAKQAKIRASTDGGGEKVSFRGRKPVSVIKEEPVKDEVCEDGNGETKTSESVRDAGEKRKNENNDSEALRRQKRRLFQMDLVDEDDDHYVSKIPIPGNLKKHLTDEWRMVTPQDSSARLVMLPKKSDHTVESIIKAFLTQKIAKLEKDKVQVNDNCWL